MGESGRKACSKCGRDRPATTEYFRLRADHERRLHSWCRDCEVTARQEYRTRRGQEIAGRPPEACYLCGDTLTEDSARLDAVRGGRPARGNADWLCALCKRMKGTLDVTMFLAKVREISGYSG